MMTDLEQRIYCSLMGTQNILLTDWRLTDRVKHWPFDLNAREEGHDERC